jgi:hypothetical protein
MGKKDTSKLHQILEDLNVIEKNKKNNILTNLTKIPKENRKTMPSFQNDKKYGIEQADLLFLPEDEGYKYLLVVVDIATSLCDAEKLKTKNSDEVRKAMQKIFKRKILKPPQVMDVDDGNEFKGDFKRYYHKIFDIAVKEPGRHRQQAIVENKNYILGKILNQAMLSKEINSGETSREWVDLYPKVIKLMNEKYGHEPKKIDPYSPEKVDKNNREILDVGTKVRVALDNPIDYVTGKRLHGRWRAGDIRWDKNIKTVTQFYLMPNQPPMYQLDNNPHVSYSREQLQLVKNDEVKPLLKPVEKFVISKLLKRFKKNNKIYFEVLWNTGEKTDEPRSNLIKDVKDLVLDFEKSNK